MFEQSATEKLLADARTLVEQGQYAEAIESYQTAMARSEHVDERLFAFAINGLGIVYMNEGKPQPALDCFIRAYNILCKRKEWRTDGAVVCDSIGVIYNNLGDYSKALEYEFRSLKIFNQLSEFTHAAEAFNNIGATYLQMGRYNDARKYLQRSLKIYEKMSKTGEAACGQTLNNFAVLYCQQEDYPKAIEYLKRALAIHEKICGADHPDTIVMYINIGVDYANLLDYKTALGYTLHALELLEKNFWIEHPLCNKCYDSLGGIYSGMGNYASAFEYLQKSLALVIKTKGKLHLDTANEYKSLSTVCRELGDYEQAMQYLLNDMEIRKNALGAEHPEMANVYGMMGIVYSDLGDYPNSLVYQFHALRIREKALGANHPDTADSLSEIGRVYCTLNDYKTGLNYEIRALEIYIHTFGKESLKAALAYNNICLALGEMGDYKKALEFGLRSLKIEQEVRGAEHPALAITYHTVASAYVDLRDYSNAIKYESHALEIQNRAFGVEHPNSLPILQSLSHIYFESDQYDKAIEYSLRALEIQQKLEAPEHPDFIAAYANIAFLLYMTRNASAVKYTKKLMGAMIQSNISVFYISQEELRLALLNDRRRSTFIGFSVAFSYPAQFDGNELYTFELGNKNLVAEAAYVQSSLANEDKTSDYAEKYSALLQLRSQYAKYSLEGFPEIPKREELERQILDSEYALAPYYREIDFKLHMQQATPDAIREKMPDHAALLEYGSYFHLPDVPYMHVQTGAGNRYFSFLVKKDGIRLIELGDCTKIDTLIEQARILLIKTEDADELLHSDAGEVLRSLYQCLISPIENELAEINQLFIAPDSELFKLPFEILQDEAGEQLFEKIPAISYISTGRDLLRFPDKDTASSFKDITIIANPEFDLGDGEIKLPDNQEDDNNRNILPQSSRDMDGQLKADTIYKLPFTAVEADWVATLFGNAATVLSGNRATKSAIRQLASPSVVHLSTHGFTFAPQQTDVEPNADQFDFNDRGKRHGRAENPMLRCGLVLAGVCNWLKGETLPDKFGDGILNGMDVLSLDLSKTDLMVLSACQTGLGDIQTGEGIQGMRRAFELAGVHTLICTLWKVDDLASTILMKAFYKNLLQRRLSKAAALAAAKEYIRTLTSQQLQLDGWVSYVDELLDKDFDDAAARLQDALNGKPTPTPFAHPFFWAGFILQGEA